MDKMDLVVTVLQQRIGEIVSNYETQIAVLRAEITQLVDEKNQKQEALEQYSEEIIAKIAGQE